MTYCTWHDSGVTLKRLLGPSLILVLTLAACASGDGSPGGEVRTSSPSTTLGVVDIRAEIERTLQDRGITGTAVYDDGAVVTVYLPDGTEDLGRELSGRFGARVRVEYGPPMKPLGG